MRILFYCLVAAIALIGADKSRAKKTECKSTDNLVVIPGLPTLDLGKAECEADEAARKLACQKGATALLSLILADLKKDKARVKRLRGEMEKHSANCKRKLPGISR